MNFTKIGVCVEDNLLLKTMGLKITMPRLKILQILEQSTNHHLSAENIYKILINSGYDIGMATIYRVLTQFEAVGLVSRHYFEDRCSVFELCDIAHHDHLVCTKCESVEEFLDDIIEDRQNIIANKAQFKITNHSLIIYGVCIHCQK